MKELPPDWERNAIRTALLHAGYGYREELGNNGRSVFAFGYGPDEHTRRRIVVQCTAGAMSFRMTVKDSRRPDRDALIRANNFNRESGFGKLVWTENHEAWELTVSVFAYPDWAPPGPAVQFLCHQMWSNRDALAEFRQPTLPTPPGGPPVENLVNWISEHVSLPFQESAGRYTAEVTSESGPLTLTISAHQNGGYLVDVRMPDLPEWPETPDGWQTLNAVNARLMRGAAIRTEDGQVVVREALPAPFVVTDHAQWAGLLFDHASAAAQAVRDASARLAGAAS